MKKTVALILLVFLLLPLLASCAEKTTEATKTPLPEGTATRTAALAPAPSKTPESAPAAETGNSPGNSLNWGLVAGTAEWIYYQNKEDGNSIYRMRPDGSKKEKLNSDESYYINVFRGYVYYCNAGDGWKAYRMLEDGSGQTPLNDTRSQDINVAGDWIYFINGNIYADVPGPLCRMRLDGTGMQRLTEDTCEDINVTEEGIYYVNWSDGGKVYRMEPDGTGSEKINDDPRCVDLNILDGRAYYRSGSGDDKTLVKMRTDGTERAELYRGSVYCLNVSGEYIYFCNWDQDGELPGPMYRISVNGGEALMLDPAEGCSDVNVYDGWIYHIVLDGREEIVRLKTDGSERQKVS